MMRNLISTVTLFIVICFFAGCDSSGEMATGAKAPDFTLKNQEGEDVALAKLKGQNVILLFFGRTDNESAIAHVKNFNDDLDMYKNANCVVLAINHQVDHLLKVFHDNNKLHFDLLSDPTQKTIKDYGVQGGLGFAKRTTFIIDKDGIIRNIIDDADTDTQREDIHSAVKDLANAK